MEVEEPDVPEASSVPHSEPVQEVNLTKIDLLKRKVSISLEKKENCP